MEGKPTYPKLTDRQLQMFCKDMTEFGYPTSKSDLRAIADRVCDGNPVETDPIDLILGKQLAEAYAAVRARRSR